MGIDAIALLRIDVGAIRKALPAHSSGEGKLQGRNGQPLRAEGLGDGTLVHTFARFGSEPADLGMALRMLLGDLLDQHQDERGIYVLPDVAQPESKSYAELIEEMGEAGFWVPHAPADHVAQAAPAAEAGGLDSLMGDVMNALPDGALGDIQRAMSSGDMSSLMQMATQVQQAMAGREKEVMDALQSSMGSAKDMLDKPGASPEDLAAGLPFSDGQAGDILEQARKQAEAMLQQDPSLQADLERRLGLTRDGQAAAGNETAEGQDESSSKPKDDEDDSG